MRKLSGLSYKFIYVYFVIIGLFHLYTSVFGAYESYLQKNIHLGPTLPAFLSPNVAAVLVNNFGISGIGTAEDDIEKFGLS